MSSGEGIGADAVAGIVTDDASAPIVAWVARCALFQIGSAV